MVGPAASASPAQQRVAASSLLLVTAWFGLLAGLAEVALKATQKFGVGAFFTDREAVQRFGFSTVVHASRDIVWMAPLAGAVAFMLVGLMIVIITRFRPRANGLRWAASGMTFLGLLDLFYLYPRLHRYAAMVLAFGAAWQVGRLVTSRGPGFYRLVRRTLPVLVGAIVVLGVGQRVVRYAVERRAVGQIPLGPPDAPNVLLIVLDAVAARHMSLHGYDRPTTPNLDRLAAQSGVIFDRAIATAPWTLPSHAGMFTGRYPDELSADWKIPLDQAFPTLAEEFSKRGYRTAGFAANTRYCSYENGLDRGFQHYEDYPVAVGQIAWSFTLLRVVLNDFRLRRLIKNDEHLNRQPADRMSRRFLDWLPERSDRPFFAFINYFDAHDPYLPPAPFDRKFGPGRAAGKHSPLLHAEWDPDSHERSLSSADLQEEIDAYDGAIAYLDYELGQLFDRLRERGLLERTVIVVTSDHGQEFGEHGVYYHGNSLYLPSLHVPLLISFEGETPPLRVSAPTTLADLPATLADITDGKTDLPGRSLAHYWRGKAPTTVTGSPLLSQVRRVSGRPNWFPVTRGDMTSLVVDGMRYIRNGDGKEELYDFENDPWEKTDLASRPDSRPLLEQMRTHLQNIANP